MVPCLAKCRGFMFSVGSARLSASSLAGDRFERVSRDTIIMSFGLRSAARTYSPVGLARGGNQMSHATRLLGLSELLVTVLGLAACSGGGGGGNMGQMQLAVADRPCRRRPGRRRESSPVSSSPATAASPVDVTFASTQEHRSAHPERHRVRRAIQPADSGRFVRPDSLDGHGGWGPQQFLRHAF